jgi:hypothetical protein
MRSHFLEIGWPIFSLLLCVGSGSSSAQNISWPDSGLSIIKTLDPASPEAIVISVQLGPPSGYSPLPNRTPPPPPSARPNPSPSSPLPTPLPSTSSPNTPRAGTVTPGAQNLELGVPTLEVPSTKAPPTASRPNGRTRKSRYTRRAPNSTDSEDVSDISMPRLPSVIRNCEHPAPRFCKDL